MLITDTNIWIDLDNGGILVDVFHLPTHFITPDVATIELIKPRWDMLQALGLVFQELTSEQVVELVQLRHSHRNLSAIDLASFLLAKSLHATLLTGTRGFSNLLGRTICLFMEFCGYWMKWFACRYWLKSGQPTRFGK